MKGLSQTVCSSISGHDWLTLLAATTAKSVIVLLGVWLLLRLWHSASASMRHWLWLLALISLAMLPLKTSRGSGWTVPLWKPAPANNELASVVGEAKSGLSVTGQESKQIGVPSIDTKVSGSSARARENHATSLNLSTAFFFAWLTGVLFLFGRIVLAQRSVRQLESAAVPINDADRLLALDRSREQLGLRRKVRLLEGPNSLLPMTWGMWRPVILLPREAKDWSAERLHIVLQHELAHVKRRDCGTQLIAQLMCALYWFNPLARLAARQMAIERERACDDLVLGSGATPSSYAGHLLEIARRFHVGSLASSAAIAIARPPQIAERIVAIVDARRNRRSVTLLMSLCTVLLAAAFIGTLSLCRLQAQPADNMSAKDLSVKFSHLKPFFATKEKQARALVKQEAKAASPDIWAYFDAAAKDDWNSVTNIYWQMMRRRSPRFEGAERDPGLETMALQPIHETYGFLEYFALGEEKYVRAFGKDVIDSIPPGSIYFGGNGPQWIITGMSKSHENADPFFTLSQNSLADGLYLKYLRTMYGGKIYTPTDEDSKAMLDKYLADAQARMGKGQLRPGEDIRIVDGKPKASGHVGVMAINALLAKKIFDKNPDREFYIVESFPLDWMYPHLTPNGLIMKINRQPLAVIPDDVLRKDHDYWSRYTARLIGDWLKDDTSVAEICRRAEKVHLEKDFGAFGGDPKFTANDYSCKMFSKLRASLGGVYWWRADQSRGDPKEKQRMTKEADYAFRQAYALCPYSPEALYRYVNMLASDRRFDDALLLGRTSSKLEPANSQLPMLIAELERMRTSGPAPGAAVEGDTELEMLEAVYRAFPFNFTNATSLAQKYASVGRTSDVLRIADAFVANPQSDARAISFAAQVYQQLPNYPKLETALARWVQLTPTPEAWFDLAASQAVQKKETETLASLRQALSLNEARLKKDPKANDIQTGLKNDARFMSLWANPHFQKLLSP